MSLFSVVLMPNSQRACALTGLGVLAALTAACATQPVTADLRPSYEARRAYAAADLLDCNEVSDVVCTCRREGLQQEFANPQPAYFDEGYKALVAYQNAPENAGQPVRYGETHAVDTIFAAIAKSVENICSYHEEEAAK